MTQSTPDRLSLARIPGRRSTLHAWYVREWEVLRGGSINWTWLMSEIAARKLTDRCGRHPTLQTARQTWYRVKKEMASRAVSRVVPLRKLEPSSGSPPISGGRSQFPPARIKE